MTRWAKAAPVVMHEVRGRRNLVSVVWIGFLMGVGCVLLLGRIALVLAAPPLQGAGAVLIAAGDIADCDSTRDTDTANLLDTTPGTVATLGDNVYERGALAEFEECYEPAWGRHNDRIRPAAGNHEYETDGATGYYTYFGAAASPLDSPCTTECKGYYSYDLGAWHIVVLNSEIAAGAGSAQEQWLRSDLAATPAMCTLAYWHTPRFSSGSKLVNNKMAALWQALYDHGADVVLNGHEHFYERFAPQTPDGEADAAHGIRQFIVGTGGRSSYSAAETQALARDILHERQDEWVDWKCARIAGFVEEIRGEIAGRSLPTQLGIFSLPWRRSDFDGALRRVAGQDLGLLRRHVDIVSPMVYHKLCQQPASWVQAVTRDAQDWSGRAVLPIIQAMDRPDVMTPAALDAALAYALDTPAQGVMIFTLDPLLASAEKRAVVRKHFV